MNVPMRITITVNKNILTDDFYKKYKAMIDKAAWEATRICNIDFYELQSRGNLIFCEAAKSWDPKKGSFSTHLTWCLKTLKGFKKEMYAPKTCTEERNFWVSLDQKTLGKDGDEIGTDPFEASLEYSQKMEEAIDDPSWEARLPDFRRYMDAMDEDTKMLCNDILDGQFDNAEMAGRLGRKHYIASMSKIPTNRFYSKRYMALGWTKERTQFAVDNLRQLLRQWKTDRLPCTLIRAKKPEPVELF